MKNFDSKIVDFGKYDHLDYSEYNAEFEKIGKDKSAIFFQHNFMLEDDCKKIHAYLEEYKDDDSFKGGNDKRKKQVAKENLDVFALMESYEILISKTIKEQYVDKYGVKVNLIPTNDSHFVKWVDGMASPLHADNERPDGQPAFHANFYRLNLSALVYINDNFDGGEIEFPSYNLKIKPQAGDLIIFPSNFRHAVLGVKGPNNRYTMPSWYVFDLPELKFNQEIYDAEDSVILWKNDGEDYEETELF
jgi:predicted 2-oxoglutarate/Fe(II)-dependent dioxygenase YbiX